MTYASLAVVFLAAAVAVALTAAWMLRLPRQWWWTTAIVSLVLAVLTGVFDSLMIATDLFRYGDGSLVGLRIALVPIEDFAWPLAAALALPALWELLGWFRMSAVQGVEHDTPDTPVKSGASARDH